jgi:hypothetical protein
MRRLQTTRQKLVVVDLTVVVSVDMVQNALQLRVSRTLLLLLQSHLQLLDRQVAIRVGIDLLE